MTGAEPRQAATVIVVRGGRDRLEVVLARRNPLARFMGGAWVFPGGACDAGESHRVAALRELAEEAGLILDDPGALIAFSRWITPPQIPTRFDTHFFLAAAPPGQEPRADGAEMLDAGWFAPTAALAAHDRGELALVFPTIKHLEQLATFPGTDALLAWAAGREITAVEPHLHGTGEHARMVLPGEPGYDG